MNDLPMVRSKHLEFEEVGRQHVATLSQKDAELKALREQLSCITKKAEDDTQALRA
jgi:hypothetical protein